MCHDFIFNNLNTGRKANFGYILLKPAHICGSKNNFYLIGYFSEHKMA